MGHGKKNNKKKKNNQAQNRYKSNRRRDTIRVLGASNYRGRMGHGKKIMKKNNQAQNKSGGNSDSAAALHRILVKCWTCESAKSGVRSEWFVVDLKQKIVMKNPHAVWSRDIFDSMAALHEEEEGTLSILNVGVYKLVVDYDDPPTKIPINKDLDYIHSLSEEEESDTCISTLDFTNTPPTWSNWKPGPKINFKTDMSYFAVLDNKIFVFHGISSNSTNPEVYQIVADDDDDNDNNNKWGEKITRIPFRADLTLEEVPLWSSFIQPISHPNNNRFIAYFPDNNHSIYAYYPETKEWKFLHHLCPQGEYIFSSFVIANQVVLDNLILCLDIDDQIFMAYNILNNHWLLVDVVDDGSVEFPHPPEMYFACDSSKLVLLGNDILCLAIPHMVYPHHDNIIQFLTFKVNHVKEERVQLIPLSFTTISPGNIYGFADTFIPF